MFLEPDYFFPLFKENPARNRVVPQTVRSPPPSQWTIAPSARPNWHYQLERIIPPEILGVRAEIARLHYEKMIEGGYITINKSDMLVGPNLLLSPRDWEPLTAADVTHAPPRVFYGPNSRRNTSSVSETTCTLRSSYGDICHSPEPRATFDCPLYGPFLRAWSNAPDRVHWAWKAGLERLQSLPEGERSEAALRKLNGDAGDAEKHDYRLLSERVDAMNELRALSDQDLLVTLPGIFGRILGLAPPTNLVLSDHWEYHYSIEALNHGGREAESERISDMLRQLKRAKYAYNFPSQNTATVQQKFRELLNFFENDASRFGRWMEPRWVEFRPVRPIVLD
ncbi:uncharacterized protein Triagg1_1383 [Trichoderma aggressivum f. europaeum]|uniref:Uncharacterized protein n=1 Tax=Trichoderma aggressivum f. europaeum TaxID=173218 RepID=A0AAE1M309_9HYPO|nr:hypothetical protein Triagg1_1383 [Trichoderma aggressivum f. europaeum]